MRKRKDHNLTNQRNANQETIRHGHKQCKIEAGALDTVVCRAFGWLNSGRPVLAWRGRASNAVRVKLYVS